VIGILPQDDDAHLVERRRIERVEIFAPLREDMGALRPALLEEGFELLHVRLGEFGGQGRLPGRIEFDVGNGGRFAHDWAS